jgi:hypothetical protein
MINNVYCAKWVFIVQNNHCQGLMCKAALAEKFKYLNVYIRTNTYMDV